MNWKGCGRNMWRSFLKKCCSWRDRGREEDESNECLGAYSNIRIPEYQRLLIILSRLWYKLWLNYDKFVRQDSQAENGFNGSSVLGKTTTSSTSRRFLLRFVFQQVETVFASGMLPEDSGQVWWHQWRPRYLPYGSERLEKPFSSRQINNALK
jgi:hypothetical protein